MWSCARGLYFYLCPVKGVSQSYLEQLELAEGRLPQPGELGLVFGNGVIRDFTNAKTGKGYWDTGEMPDVDPMGKPMFVILTWMLTIKVRVPAALQTGLL